MGASVRPVIPQMAPVDAVRVNPHHTPNENAMSDADLWELKKGQGFDDGQATQYVKMRQQGLDTDRGSAAITGLAQGATLGFADEILGGVNALDVSQGGTMASRYAEGRDKVRAVTKDSRAKFPGTTIGTEMLGGALVPLGALGEAKPALGLATKVSRGINTGAGVGAVAGAGNAEGSLRDRAAGAAVGAALGAGVGGALPLGVATAGRVVSGLGIRPQQSFTQEVQQAILNGAPESERDGLLRYAQNDPHMPSWRQKDPFIGGQQQRVGAVSIRSGNGGNAPSGTLREALGMETVQDKANEYTLRQFENAGKSVQGVRAELQGLPSDVPYSPADALGPTGAKALNVARSLPGAAKNEVPALLHGRGAGTEDRVIGRLMQRMGLSNRTNITQSLDEMATARAAEAEKNYGAVYDHPVPRDQLAPFFKDEAVQKAYARASRIAQREGKPMPALSDLVDAQGNLTQDLTIRDVDRIKRGLDDVLDVGGRSPLDAGGLGREEMSSLRGLKNELLGVADQASPEYAKARSAFAGRSAMMKALDMGRGLLKGNREELAAEVAQMGESEQEQFRKGAMEAIADHVENIRQGRDVAASLDSKTSLQKRLRLAFPDAASYEAFRRDLTSEAQMHRTKLGATGGSDTAEKLAGMADLFGADIGSLFSGKGWKQRVAESAIGAVANRSKVSGGAIASDAAKKLLAGSQGDRAQALQVLDVLEASLAKKGKNAAKARAVQGAAADVIGGEASGRRQ